MPRHAKLHKYISDVRNIRITTVAKHGKGVRFVSDELTSRDVAALLGVSERAVLYAVNRGDLPATVVVKGKKRYWRFARSDVETYRRQLQTQPAESSEV
jgi:excisionase family DNA binding protein